MRALFNRNVLSRSRVRRISKTTGKCLMLGLGASIGALLLSWKYVAAQDLDTELEIQEEAKEIQQFQGDKEMIKNWQNKELWAKEQVQLIDENGNIGNAQQLESFFASIPSETVSVVSVIGELRSGKSHLLNTLFFHRGGSNVFKEGKQATAVTKGCWVSYSGDVLLIDCEGSLDPSLDRRVSENRKLDLLKIIALSDVVIYLSAGKSINQNDINLLTELSTKYLKTISNDLEKISLLDSTHFDRRIVAQAKNAGPALLIYHRRPNEEVDKLSDSQFQDLFNSKLPTYQNGGCFRSVLYCETVNVDFARDYVDLFDAPLARTLAHEIRSSYSMRRRKQPREILDLTTKLCGIYKEDAPYVDLALFWYERYTCPQTCLSCQANCQEGFNHQVCAICRTKCEIVEHHVGNYSHRSSRPCKKHAQFDNVVHMCKLCQDQGNGKREVKVSYYDDEITDYLGVPYLKWLWRGDRYYCNEHGHIGESHVFFFAKNDTSGIIYDEIVHKWNE